MAPHAPQRSPVPTENKPPAALSLPSNSKGWVKRARSGDGGRRPSLRESGGGDTLSGQITNQRRPLSSHWPELRGEPPGAWSKPLFWLCNYISRWLLNKTWYEQRQTKKVKKGGMQHQLSTNRKLSAAQSSRNLGSLVLFPLFFLCTSSAGSWGGFQGAGRVSWTLAQ